MSSDLKNDYRLNQTDATPLPSDAGSAGTVVALMSGGVDSSAAALLLRNAGYDVVGLTMRITETGEDAIRSAAGVCAALSVPHFWVDLWDEFRTSVIEPFCTSYIEGETPNPCANCNERVKLGLLSEIASAYWGEDTAIATGHYARILERDGARRLARAADTKKDQSYFLAGVPDAVIRRLIFPLGEMRSKEETRKLVRDAGLPVSERPDSMELCFASERDYRNLIERPGKPGPIMDTAGNEIGRHSGITNYTPGQRKGLGIAAPHPLYVIEIRPRHNTIVAAPRELAFTHVVHAERLNVLLPEATYPGAPLFGKIRSQGDPSACRILEIEENGISVEFDAPLFAPAPGQRLVLYTAEGCVVLGAVIVGKAASNIDCIK